MAASSSVGAADKPTRYALRTVLVITTLVRAVPVPFLAFLALYGIASIGTNEYELIGGDVIFVLNALLIVGSILLVASLISTITNRPSAMAVVSGLILVIDLIVLAIFIFSDEVADSNNQPLVVAVIAAVQTALFAWTLWTARKS